MDELQELTQDFLIEAFEMIEQLDQDLVELESRPDDLELLNGIFRVAHTVKGSSSFLNFDILTRLTHHMEDVLNKARRGELAITAEVMDVVLPSIDLMKGLLTCIRDHGDDTTEGIDVDGIVAQLDVISSGGSLDDVPDPVEAPIPTSEVTPEPAAVTTPPEPEAEVDYASMSDDDVEAEIENWN